MKDLQVLLALTMISLAMLMGCGKSQDRIDAGKDVLSNLQADAVLAKIGLSTLTKKGREDYAALRVAFYRLMDKSVTPGMKESDKEKRLEKVKASALKAAFPYFIQNSVIGEASEEFKKVNGDYTAEQKDAVDQWLQKQYVSAENKSARSFKAVRNRMVKEGVVEAFDQQIAYEKEAELYLRFACSNRYPIAEYVISNVYHRFAVNDYFAAQTNAAILATASNVIDRIKSGEDFSDLADKYSMEEGRNAGGYLGSCTVQDFPSEEVLWEAVKNLPEGASTGIIDADDSWQILKVINRDETDKGELKLDLARIYFRRAYRPEKPSRELLIETLEAERRNQLAKEIMAERLPKVKIEFPYGREVLGDLEPAKGMLDVIDGKVTNVVETTSAAQGGKK